MDILPPRYRDAELIGRGGMGEIYRARDEVLGRTVAIKVLAERYAENPDVRKRFTREALAAARLSGESGVVTIFDVGEWNERPYIVMEFLGGGSLDNVLRSRGPQPPRQALQWLDEAARAIDAAHAQGIVHRDVKPANLLLDQNRCVHVADFGIASAAGLDSLTLTGTVLGTAGYLSPEQAQGERATPASDRYALAVLAFELLTGTRPYETETATAEALGHVQAPIPPISDRNPMLPEELDAVFDRALAKNPDARFSSCAEFVAALRRAFADAAETTRRHATVAPTRQQERPSRRPVLPLALAGLLAAGLAGVALATALTADDDEPAARGDVKPRTLVRTVTATGADRTVPVTVTMTAPAAPPPPPPAATTTGAATPPPPPGQSAQARIAEGIALTDQATNLIRAGRYAEALPVAQQALARLRGSGETYEAYANYDVGKALAELNRCPEAIPYLRRRQQLIRDNHPDVNAALRKCGAAP